MLTAFKLGLPVIGSSIQSYEPFSGFYAKLGTDDAQNLFEKPERWHGRVLCAQKEIGKTIVKIILLICGFIFYRT